MSISEACKGSGSIAMLQRPEPPIDYISDALLLLDLYRHSRPPIPPLVFTDPYASKDTKKNIIGLDFAPIWKYLEEASGGKTAEERLGEYAWVLDYGMKNEDTASFIIPRLSEEDTAVATSDESDSNSDDSTKPTIAFSVSLATLAKDELVPSAITCNKAIRKSTLKPDAAPFQTLPQPAPTTPPPPTVINLITNAFNVLQHAQITASANVILPLTLETQIGKRRKIVEKLYSQLANDGIDNDLCSIVGTSLKHPYESIHLHVEQGGLHVFVDMSNIYVGFVEHLRRARGINLKVRLAQPVFNFSDFSFILERCRPTSRRVLVGSCTNSQKMPYHLEAAHCGYEVCLLERVSKVRLPPSVRRIHSQSGYASTSDVSPMGRRTNVEQGVDELLQMKMLESLIDSETPSTIVLATGDAAVAEFSGGFLVNVKRALQKGWNVELVGWHANMSKAYWKLTQEWGEKFRVIFLDDMAEELLAWYIPDEP